MSRRPATIKSLMARVKRLEYLCAEMYQVAGEVGAPVRVLDALSAAADGRPIPRASLLPISASEFDRP
jgi:hypothetical protein